MSWVPVASDYSRHSRTVRDAVVGTFVGYSVTQIACYAIGLIALVTVATGDPDKIFGAFIAVPLGTLAFAILAVRELDQSFVDTYSAAVSVQNFRPRWDRRVLAIVVGTLATVLALALDISDYENFLLLIGSVFVPLLGVLVVDYFVVSRRSWDLDRARADPLVDDRPWLAGFVAYQLINPGYVVVVVDGVEHVHDWLDFTPQSWMSASLLSFLVAARSHRPVGADREDCRRCSSIPRSLTRSPPADRSSRSRARSSATACRVRTTCGSPATSRRRCARAAPFRPRSRSSTARPTSAWTTPRSPGSPATPTSSR